MNLGDSNLKHVNTSRPQLVHSSSKQSVTASDDYYSLTSEASSSDERNAVRQYETPPMHMRSADESRHALQSEAKQSEATIPTIRPVKHKDPADEDLEKATTSGEHKIRRKPTSSSSSQSETTIKRRPIDEVSPPTPGVDDTPYIQFAIDQLTRDEEVAGPRHEGLGSEASYPVDRIVPDQGLGYYDQRLRGQYPDPERRRQDSPPPESVLIPTEPTTETFRYPKLNFVPRPLRVASLAILILYCLLMIAGLLFCAIYPTNHSGLWTYDGVGTGRYFIFQYLPTLLASLIIIWVMVIQGAIYRVFPFVTLAHERVTMNSAVLRDSALFPTNYLLPNMAFFRYQEPLLGLCSITFWLALFSIPLQASLFQSRYYLPEGIWRWTAAQPIAWTLFVLYLLLAIALVLLLIRFATRRTGLKWDPVCLADILSLFHRANFLSDFQRSEVEGSPLQNFPAKHLRLGYWMTSNHTNEAFYGIGEENVPVRRYSLERGKMKAVTDLSKSDLERQRPEESSTFDTLERDIHIPDVRYRWLPWFLKDGFVVAWIIIALVLMIAFVVVSFVNNAVKTGFLPMLPAPTTPQGFSPADFLYSFVPALIGTILFLVWQPIDMYFRALQPFANLSRPHGCSADSSLLLDYTSRLPIEVTLTAAVDGHFKVAWVSFNSVLAITLPILAGGVFTAQFVVHLQSVRMAADMTGYYALVVFVIIYALSFLIIWPGRRRELPHDINTVGQLISFFYQSPLLSDDAFREPKSKIDLQTKLIGTPRGEKASPKYAFGVFTGQDGREHLGIDRLERPASRELSITTWMKR
ncbi:hypothetical protein N7G274_004226 [Stereocaulon virgatum]|uniref:Phosphoribosylaminoimidazole-succinocarboxamide synthase n=1 Tax=Stereocaulon virgatum TaxID=373712 RepID=A0ABR4ACG3_9LECA